jgi:hypothetical protein
MLSTPAITAHWKLTTRNASPENRVDNKKTRFIGPVQAFSGKIFSKKCTLILNFKFMSSSSHWVWGIFLIYSNSRNDKIPIGLRHYNYERIASHGSITGVEKTTKAFQDSQKMKAT